MDGGGGGGGMDWAQQTRARYGQGRKGRGWTEHKNPVPTMDRGCGLSTRDQSPLWTGKKGGGGGSGLSTRDQFPPWMGEGGWIEHKIPVPTTDKGEKPPPAPHTGLKCPVVVIRRNRPGAVVGEQGRTAKGSAGPLLLITQAACGLGAGPEVLCESWSSPGLRILVR